MSDESEIDPNDIEKCAQWINSLGLKKVCLQFPDHLLGESIGIALKLENLVQNKVYILGDTVYGSCCVDEIAAEHINADGIIHFGHACLSPTSRLPVFHVLPRSKIDIEDVCNKFQQKFTDQLQRILLFYDVKYAFIIESIYAKLSALFKNLILTRLNCKSSIEYSETLHQNSLITCCGRSFNLDCEYMIEDYEAFFLGQNDKTFSIFALSIPAKKWCYISNNNEIVEFDLCNTPWLKRRRFLIEKLKDAKVVGVVVATLGIERYLEAITAIKNILKIKNKKSYVLSVGKINPCKLANFPEVDAFVVITCPENEVFDSRDFSKPILMPYEVDLAFNSQREFSMQYCMDFRQILPGGINYVNFKPSKDTDISLISGEIRNGEEVSLVDSMNALVCPSSGTVALGNAGAQYLQQRSWIGVEQRLGKDIVKPAEIGRSGLPLHYENEPVSNEKQT